MSRRLLVPDVKGKLKKRNWNRI